MKRMLSFILALVLLIGLMPMRVVATEAEHIHSYESVVTAPTCTEQGYTTYTCACGDSYMSDYVDAEGEHDFTNWYITKEASYNADGEESRDCKKCSHVEFRSVKLEVVTSGNAGKGTPYTDDVTYTLYADGTMVISGNGTVYCSDWRGDYQPYKDYRTQVKTLIVEEGITATAGGCFAHFYNLETVSLPDSLTKIDGNAFMSSFASSITSIVIPKTVTYIGAYSYGFYYGKGGTTFTDVVIENPNVRLVDHKAVFNAGNNLANLTLYSYGANNNVSAYAEKYGCKYVDLDVYKTGIYSGVEYMYYDGVLTLSAAQTDATIAGEDAPWNAEKNNITKIVIKSGITGISANAFKDYYHLESIEINNEIRHIGDGAFSTTETCDSALNLALPRTVKSVGSAIFAGRQNITLTAYLGSAAAEINESGVTLHLKKQFKVLLIGNSYSEDASSCGQGMQDSQLLNILQAMLGEDAEVTVALLSSGGKGINWHATQAEQGNAAYSFKIISSNSPTWTTIGSASSYQALTWTDWDVVSLQPYNISASTGIEAVPYPDGTDMKFRDLKTASEFLLDYVGTHAPDADIYCYMHWSQTTGTTLNANLSHYNKFAAQYLGMMEHAGTTTGTKYTSLIPVGLSIQNARSTYLALLAYNTGVTLDLTTDTQMGLQRDGGHLSFNVGRYIAGLTFAEMIVPQEWRADNYVLPEIRVTESVGQLPKEYSIIAQKSVHAAVESWKNGSLAVTDIVGYTEDPTVAAGKALEGMSFALHCDTAERLAAQLSTAVLAALPADFAVDAVALDEAKQIATVTIRFGYTSLVVNVGYAIATHSYESVATAPTCTEQGYTTYTCTACGDSYVGDYVAATGHSYENVICAVCGAVKPMESVDSVDALVTALRQAMVRRQNQIQLRLNGIVLASTEISDLVKKAMAHTGIPYEGDYIRANMVGYSWALTTGSDDTGVYSIVTVTCNFISDAQMEAEVDAAVEALLNKLNLWNASNYEKVKGVYDWITENVSYDYDWDDLEDDTNYYKHTTYAALIDKNAVCQGIASLYYRLMLELGVDCRYISGISTDITGTERHAWNIVYLDGKYYNCDPTWDLGLTGYYRHFLCTKGNFSGHTRDAEFDTTQFHTDYPMAVTPYVLNVAASGTVNSKISWVLDGDTGTLTVAGTGAIPSYRSSRAPWYDYRESVRKIVISEGITEVGERAFYWCTNCTQVDLPDSLVAIREYGFNNLRSLKNITLPSKLKTIEFCAFSECVALTSITLPDSVTTVGSNAFSNCYELTSAVLSGGMKTIPSSMFGGDSKLKTVVLPEGVTYIDDTAFINCGFYSFTLPASVTGLGTSVFSGCTYLSKFIVEEGNSAYKAVDGVLFSADGTHLICYPSAKTGNYTVPEGTKYIDYGAFRSQRYMYYVYFPSTLIKIDGYAFSYCKYLTGVTFNSNITTIGDSAFRSCTNLKSVTFENPNVTLVGYTFADCTALRTITLPSKLKEIPNGLFSGCTNLQSITIPSTVTKIGSSAFIDCDSLTTITIPGTVKSIGQQAFDFCNKLETIVFEEGVTTLGWLCIRNAPKLKKVVIPSSVTTIDQPSNTTSYTFDDCPNMVLYVTCGSYIHSYAVRKGLSHQVSHTVKAVITAPTCTKQGYTTYTCSACGDSYVADHTDALGHTAGADADCTNAQTCTVCGVVLNPALGHSYDSVVTAPTCTEQGYTTYTCACGDRYVADHTDALGHTAGADADCTNPQVCTVCGVVLNAALGHSYDSVVTAPDCVNGGYITYTCSACGDSYVADYTDALGHTAGADADCTNAQTCTICGVVLNPAWGHSYDSVVTAPDCVNGGYTTYTCTACGDSYVADYTDALGHTAGAAADCTNAQVCTVCGVELNPAQGHSYNAVVTAPDCVNGGYTTYTCTACGDSYVADYTAALGHTAGADADCTNAQVCTVCGVVLNPALGHSYNVVVTAPDCVNGGYTTYTCSACGDSYVGDYTDATDHVYDHDNDTTCNQCGAVRQIAAQILAGGQTSVSEDVNGLAFFFTAAVSDAQVADSINTYVNGSASVIPFVDGASYKVVRMGAVVSNGVSSIDIEAKYLWDVAEDQCSFAVRIVDIPENQLDCVITARPYYVYEVDGEEIVVYGDVVSKSYNDAQ